MGWQMANGLAEVYKRGSKREREGFRLLSFACIFFNEADRCHSLTSAFQKWPKMAGYFSKTRQWRKYSDILLMYLFHLATYSLQQYFLSTSTFSDVLTSTYFKLTSTMDAAAHLASPFAVLFQPDINQTSPLTAPDPSTT